MKPRTYIIAFVIVVLANVATRFFVCRCDMTDDKRYSLHAPTKQLLQQLEGDIVIDNCLAGDLNSGFRRLQTAVTDLTQEMQAYATIRLHTLPADSLEKTGLHPIVIHERQQNGKTAQTVVYPYVRITYDSRSTIVSLLRNDRGKSGEENLNASIENLEYAFAEAIHSLTQKETPRIAFIEGHGELPEENVYDVCSSLSRYFQIDRGVLGNDPIVLMPYKAVVIADPQGAFSESDKYILDYYVTHGGRILWVMNGVRFSNDVLSQEGFTPVIAQDLNLQDMFFRYGVRIEPALVQDVQCLPIPVNVSQDPQQPNLQPMPWYYAPLLLTSQYSPITKNLAQVSCTFASPVSIVGGDDGLKKDILLATSSASRLIGVPAEVDLGDLNPDMQTFTYQFIPIAISVEGQFASIFAHRIAPEGIQATPQLPLARGKQVFAGSGSIIRNEWQQTTPLPAGYDRYSGMSFSNRDFITNAVLYLVDNEGLIQLREKEVALRLLNDKRAHDERKKIQAVSISTPIVLLAIAGITIILIRKRKYTRK
ncbi:MAG: gliding motility-associated ABC transporter substrate-binding protein GldG [Paludibacteraceae bacterium]|nr:gliding motility-associated ABC transporter substrate-binding protein GldG [Paludibacteraceae bacterium]